ncbi:MAG: hypothetical protein ACRELS_02690 [Candidatus Rokuibacteriota bacterium]
MKPLLAGVLLAALAAGCATGSYSSPPPSSGPRARCLANPGETGGMRPLIFLFCAESP